MQLTTESISKMSVLELAQLHGRLHGAVASNVLIKSEVDDAIALNLMLHQELSVRDKAPLLALADLDLASAEFGIAKGLDNLDLESACLPPAEEFGFQDVRLLSVEKSLELPQDKQVILGVVLEPMEADAHKEFESAEEIEQAAHRWLAVKQNRGLQHKQVVNSKVEIYESYIAPVDFKIGKEMVKKGTWLMMLHVLDAEIWKRIKSGALTGLSIGGFARKRKL